MALPIPRLAPVTIATLWSSLPMIRLLRDAQQFVSVAQARFEVLSFPLLRHFSWDRFRFRTRRTFFRDRQKPFEFPGRSVTIRVPELGILERKRPRPGDDHFERESTPRAQLLIFADVIVDSHVPFAHV